MKKFCLGLALLATPGVWVADLLLLGVPAFRNGWATLALFLVPLALLLLVRGAETSPKLLGAAWIVFVLGTGGWAAMRLFTGAIEGRPAVGVGDRAPNFTLRDPDGKNVSLSDFDDRRVLLVFFRGRY